MLPLDDQGGGEGGGVGGWGGVLRAGARRVLSLRFKKLFLDVWGWVCLDIYTEWKGYKARGLPRSDNTTHCEGTCSKIVHP